MRLRGWLGAGLAAVAVIVAFVVAQGGGSSGGPLNAIAKAAEVTQRQPGGHALIHATITSSTTLKAVTEAGSMDFDESGRARGMLTVLGPTEGRKEKLSMISDGATVYMSSEVFDSLPEGKKWLELDFSSAVNEAGSPASAANGPREGLKILEAVTNSEEVGEEEIDGVPTTHYRGTLKPAKKVFGVKVHVGSPRVDVWIDSRDRVRRLRLASSGTVGEAAGTTTTEMTIDYVDFGPVPQIELPHPEEVFNATSLIESNVQAAAKGR